MTSKQLAHLQTQAETLTNKATDLHVQLTTHQALLDAAREVFLVALADGRYDPAAAAEYRQRFATVTAMEEQLDAFARDAGKLWQQIEKVQHG